MNTHELQARLREASWAAPSAELRARILAQAHLAPGAIAWTDRIWFSRACRRGALAAAAVLLAFGLWSGPAAPDSPLSTADLAAISLAEEVARDAGLELEDATAIARRSVIWSRPAVALRDLTIAGALSEGGDR